MPKVSVVIPAFNAMKYLPKTVESVLSQSFSDFEVIVVNDGSSDETEQWVSQIEDARIKLISQTNQGLAAARNTGIQNSEGEYIAFLDADDLWEATKLEKQVLILEEAPQTGLVYTWLAYIDDEGIPTGRVFKNCEEGNVWRRLIEHNIVESGSVAMVRRQCFDTCGVFDQNLHSFVEDLDMWLRIARHYPFQVVREPLVYYRQHSTSASRSWEAMERSFEIVIEKTFASVPQELQNLKQSSYGFANLCLAWKALQSNNSSYQQVIHFRKQAVAHYPQVRFTKNYARLSLAILLIRYFGSTGYKRFLTVVYALRRNLSGFSSSFTTSNL
jgi:glycosyltransferase involved in cell wall biosynthesis